MEGQAIRRKCIICDTEFIGTRKVCYKKSCLEEWIGETIERDHAPDDGRDEDE